MKTSNTNKPHLGFALTGSFCTLQMAFDAMERLRESYEITPILSERVCSTDTRFFRKEEVLERVRTICKKEPITTLCEAEPIGPKKLFDLLVICPCTGNTLSKMALGITDTTVTMAAKSHRRSGRPILIALSTNDALSGSAQNLGKLMDQKGYFFVPLRQDAPGEKPASLQCDFLSLEESVKEALNFCQLQPVFRQH